MDAEGSAHILPRYVQWVVDEVGTVSHSSGYLHAVDSQLILPASSPVGRSAQGRFLISHDKPLRLSSVLACSGRPGHSRLREYS
jgi:hypothetical protein